MKSYLWTTFKQNDMTSFLKQFFPLSLLIAITFLFSCNVESTNNRTTKSTSSQSVAATHQAILKTLPFDDTSDFERADKGFIATRKDPIIKNPDGSIAMDLSWFDFLKKDAPTSVNPSLWRQSQLNSKHGLYQVTDGIYQVRGFDLANMTLLATDNGWIVIDPLTTEAVAKAAMDLVDEQLGKKPIKAVLITHSHADHFGGIKGVINEADIKNGVEVIAPEGFYEHSISENIIGGNAMKRRAMYMFGHLLPLDTTGMVGNGLGQKISAGMLGILQPTITINETGQKVTIDGLELVFQNTPEAEAPAECMFYIPKYKAFCQAEEINHNLHNLYTLRGAQVRNGSKWAKYIDETIQLFGDKTAVSFGSHHWPTWGKSDILELWTKQRDLYKFIHDETLYLANNGLTMNEIAEQIELPQSLSNFFANRGYYGTLSHNSKAQYQLYFGWFDGNPANLNALPPDAAAAHYVEYMGGAAAILEKVQTDIEKGNYRWAAMVLNHVVFADPDNQQARNLLATVYEQLAFRAESGPWRNFYLTGAQELQEGINTKHLVGVTNSNAIIVNLPLANFYDYMAVRLDRSQVKGKTYTFNMIFPDINETISLYLVNDVLHNRPGVLAENPNTTITMDKSVFNDVVTKKTTGLKMVLSGKIKIEGSKSDYADFQKMVGKPFDLLFNIVEP